jgi:hypothetical protein
MNEIELLARFRDEVPLGVSPRAEELFTSSLNPERPVVPVQHHSRVRRLRRPAMIFTPLAAAVAATVVVGTVVVGTVVVGTVLTGGSAPAGSPVLTAKLLADRAATAALAEPAVSPGQWVYLKQMWQTPTGHGDATSKGTQVQWQTADDRLTFLGGSAWMEAIPGPSALTYAQLSSLPADPAALDRYFAHLDYPEPGATQANKDVAAFFHIQGILEQYVTSPGLTAELYQALGDIPTVRVSTDARDIAGQPGVAFVLPATGQSERVEIILNATTYSYLGQASWGSVSGPTGTVATDVESGQAILRDVLVAAPGSTVPDSAPPAAAEQLAVRAAEAAGSQLITPGKPPVSTTPGQWIYRELTTGSRTEQVWATADDTEQASIVGASQGAGKLQVCARIAACASSVSWLVPAGPSMHALGQLATQSLLATLNRYQTGCADPAGDCNAVAVIAHELTGYVPAGGASPALFLALADVPGVTVQQLSGGYTALRFPFSSGITGILFSASTGKFAGYLTGSTETVITRQVPVSGPGILP